MRVDIVTILPDYLQPLRLSLLGRAVAAGRVDLRVHDLREVTTDRHRTVDDTPFGGGAGMVMTPEPWARTLETVLETRELHESHYQVEGEGLPRVAAGPQSRPVLLVPSPAGRVFDQAFAAELAARSWLIVACGRYEGIDQRFYDWSADHVDVVEVSIGDYVLFGGEVAALVMMEAIVRLLPGVLGNPESLTEESHTDGLLEYPLYTKPATWRGRDVPAVLLSGHHAAIAQWRQRQREVRTAARRPDLLPRPATVTADDLAAVGEGSKELEVRRARRGDAGELFTLQRACWLDEALLNPGVAIPAIGESMGDVVAGIDEWDTVVVRAAGRLIASGRGRRGEDRTTWQVGRLMVAPDLRGRGLGRWLLAAVEGLAPTDIERFELFTGANSVANQRMYRRAGYRPVRDPAPAGAVLMRRRRDP